jgi:putative membrane protein
VFQHFLIRYLANGVGLWVASRLISGIEYKNSLLVIAIAALVFSIANTFIRPLIILLSLPAIIVTLGLFTLVVNAFMLYLVTVIYPSFTISSFSAAIFAVIIIWLVNYALSAILKKG